MLMLRCGWAWKQYGTLFQRESGFALCPMSHLDLGTPPGVCLSQVQGPSDCVQSNIAGARLTCCAGVDVFQVLGPSDKAQSTMVAAWLTELLLDQINRDLLAGAGQSTPQYTQHVEQLR